MGERSGFFGPAVVRTKDEIATADRQISNGQSSTQLMRGRGTFLRLSHSDNSASNTFFSHCDYASSMAPEFCALGP